MNDILTAQVATLKARLVLEQERRDRADAKIEEIRDEGKEMTDEMAEDKEKTREMVTKMTQIYKSMERTYNEKIEMHEKEVEDQNLQKKQLKEDI